MKKYFYLSNLILFILVSIGNVFYIQNGLLWQKTLTSIGFVLIGLINLIYAIKTKTLNIKYCLTMVLGLILAMLGDILLEVNFIVGALFFASGHIAFFISYCFLHTFKPQDLLYGGILAIVSVLVILFVPIFNFKGIMQILCMVYAIIISFMVGKAFANLIRERNIINCIILLGSILFFISDLMLLLSHFGGVKTGAWCLATYYPAECLLGFALLFTKTKK